MRGTSSRPCIGSSNRAAQACASARRIRESSRSCPFVDSVFLHPCLQGLELATHLVGDLYVVTVDLSQTLKDRLQTPGPPAPRIREVDDLDRWVPTWRSHRFH